MSYDMDKYAFKATLSVTLNISSVGYKTEIFFSSAELLSSWHLNLALNSPTNKVLYASVPSCLSQIEYDLHFYIQDENTPIFTVAISGMLF